MTQTANALAGADDKPPGSLPPPIFPPEAGGRVPLHVIAIIVVSIALLVINASLLIINTAATMDSNAHYARSTEIKRALITFQSVITALESSQRGYLLTGQTGYLEPYHVAMRSWPKQIERLRELTVDDPNRLADITSLEGLTTAAVSRLEQTIRSSPQPGPHGNADVAGTDRATQTMDRVRGVVDRMMSEEDARMEASRREVLRDMWVGAGVAVLATVVTVAVLIALNKLLQRYIRDRESALRALREANQHLNHAGRAAHRRAHRAVAAPDPRVRGGKSQAGARAARHARQQSDCDQHGSELDPAPPAGRLARGARAPAAGSADARRHRRAEARGDRGSAPESPRQPRPGVRDALALLASSRAAPAWPATSTCTRTSTTWIPPGRSRSTASPRRR